MANLFRVKNIPEVIALEKEVSKINRRLNNIEKYQKCKNWKNVYRHKRRR